MSARQVGPFNAHDWRGHTGRGRQIETEPRPGAQLAVDPDEAAVSLDDGERGGKPESSAVAGLLGGEERIEDPVDHLWCDARATVFDVDPHMRSDSGLEVHCRVVFVDAGIL